MTTHEQKTLLLNPDDNVALALSEIAEALTLPLTSVKVYLHRARKKLRNQLSQMMPRETV